MSAVFKKYDENHILHNADDGSVKKHVVMSLLVRVNQQVHAYLCAEIMQAS
jgi:hypothetical protein